MPTKLLKLHKAFALGLIDMPFGDELTKILVAREGFAKQSYSANTGDIQANAHDRPKPNRVSRSAEAGDSVEATVVRKR